MGSCVSVIFWTTITRRAGKCNSLFQSITPTPPIGNWLQHYSRSSSAQWTSAWQNSDTAIGTGNAYRRIAAQLTTRLLICDQFHSLRIAGRAPPQNQKRPFEQVSAAAQTTFSHVSLLFFLSRFMISIRSSLLSTQLSANSLRYPAMMSNHMYTSNLSQQCWLGERYPQNMMLPTTSQASSKKEQRMMQLAYHSGRVSQQLLPIRTTSGKSTTTSSVLPLTRSQCARSNLMLVCWMGLWLQDVSVWEQYRSSTMNGPYESRIIQREIITICGLLPIRATIYSNYALPSAIRMDVCELVPVVPYREQCCSDGGHPPLLFAHLDEPRLSVSLLPTDYGNCLRRPEPLGNCFVVYRKLLENQQMEGEIAGEQHYAISVLNALRTQSFQFEERQDRSSKTYIFTLQLEHPEQLRSVEGEKQKQPKKGVEQTKASRNTPKNLVKNFIVAFTSFLGESDHLTAILQQLKGSQQSSSVRLSRLRVQLIAFQKSRKYNTSLLEQLLARNDYRILFRLFLARAARKWIQEGRMHDKPAHISAVSYLQELLEEGQRRPSKLRLFSTTSS